MIKGNHKDGFKNDEMRSIGSSKESSQSQKESSLLSPEEHKHSENSPIESDSISCTSDEAEMRDDDLEESKSVGKISHDDESYGSFCEDVLIVKEASFLPKNCTLSAIFQLNQQLELNSKDISKASKQISKSKSHLKKKNS